MVGLWFQHNKLLGVLNFLDPRTRDILTKKEQSFVKRAKSDSNEPNM